MSGAGGGAGAAEVTVWVMLEHNKKPMGTVTKIHGVTLHSDVDYVRALVKDAFSNRLARFDAADICLFLSSKTGVKASPPERVGFALEPDEPLRSQVLNRLKKTGAGADATFPDPLYLLAVAEGACGGRAWACGRRAYGLLTLPPLFYRRVGVGCGCGCGCWCHVTQSCRITQLTQLQVA